MERQKSVARRALLVDARDIPLHHLRDGTYLVTPDMVVYEEIYKRFVADHLRSGRTMPYAIAGSDGLKPTTWKAG